MKLICDRGGKYQNSRNVTDETRLRDSATRKTGCRFTAWGWRNRATQRWELHVSQPPHNHNFSDLPRAHLTLRRLNGAEKQQVKGLSEDGVSSQTILDILRN